MFRTDINAAPQRKRSGLTSHILLQQGDTETDLAMTWVEVAPGAHQKPHSHAPEQCYIIIQGHGIMTVGNEQMEVNAGDLVHFGPNETHGIENSAEGPLIYISACTPTMDFTALYDTGQLKKS